MDLQIVIKLLMFHLHNLPIPSYIGDAVVVFHSVLFPDLSILKAWMATCPQTVCIQSLFTVLQSCCVNQSDNRSSLEGQVGLEDFFSKMGYISIYSNINGISHSQRMRFHGKRKLVVDSVNASSEKEGDKSQTSGWGMVSEEKSFSSLQVG